MDPFNTNAQGTVAGHGDDDVTLNDLLALYQSANDVAPPFATPEAPAAHAAAAAPPAFNAAAPIAAPASAQHDADPELSQLLAAFQQEAGAPVVEATIPQAAPLDLPPFAAPAELPPFAAPADLPPFAAPAELPPFAAPADLPPFAGNDLSAFGSGVDPFADLNAGLPPLSSPAELPSFGAPAAEAHGAPVFPDLPAFMQAAPAPAAPAVPEFPAFGHEPAAAAPAALPDLPTFAAPAPAPADLPTFAAPAPAPAHAAPAPVAAAPAVDPVVLPPLPVNAPLEETLRHREASLDLAPASSFVLDTPEDRQALSHQLAVSIQTLETGINQVQAQMGELYQKLQVAAAHRAPIHEIADLSTRIAALRGQLVGENAPLWQQAYLLRQAAEAYMAFLEQM